MAAPPSYESVVAHIKKSLPKDPTGRDVLNAVDSLSKDHLDVLVNDAPPIKHHDAKHLEKAFAIHLARSAADLTATQSITSTAVTKITAMFTDLKTKLANVDAISTPQDATDFSTPLAALSDRFDAIVTSSAATATAISTYARGFATLTLPILGSTILLPAKLQTLQSFKDQGNQYAADAANVTSQFNTLKADFATFIQTFDTWATKSIAYLQGQIKTAVDQLHDLQQQLKTLSDAMIGLGVAAGVCGAIVVGLAFFGPATFGVAWWAAIVFAGITAGCVIALIVLAAKLKVVQLAIDTTQSTIDSLNSNLGTLLDTKVTLLSQGPQALQTFASNVEILKLVFDQVQVDVATLETALSQATSDVTDTTLATILGRDLDTAKGVYLSMATYLSAYADGVADAKAPPTTT